MKRACRIVILALLVLGCLEYSVQGAKPRRKKPATGEDVLPICNLAPSKVVPNLCLLKYRVSTASPQCQAFIDQGLGYYYSYVWMEAVRSFETATRADPECAMAWFELSRALEKWSTVGARTPGVASKATDALKKAQALQAKASHHEQLLITARSQEKGLVPNLTDAVRKTTAARTIDDLLALYDDDEEAWFYRAQLAEGVGAIPFYKALLRINPLHPGANHELVHYYEGNQRPALGWVNAENFIKSSPGIPHAFHMQAHLATRLGRWDKTCEYSTRAIDLERAYHKDLNVAPRDDFQFTHHLEVLTLSLTHDGRFKEARAIKEEAKKNGYKHWIPWFRLHLAERDWDEAARIIDRVRRSDKLTASYLAALLYLKQGNPARAAAEVDVLKEAYQKQKKNSKLEYRVWETEGILLCQTGTAEPGLKLIARAVDKSKGDYSHHAWGNGSYYMEAWGTAALQAGNHEAAEEGFLEALAHDPGNARAALGMQVLCERLGRTEEAGRYAELARRCWKRANPGVLEAELAALRSSKPMANPTTPAKEPAKEPEGPKDSEKNDTDSR